jgi:hypothetical protein
MARTLSQQLIDGFGQARRVQQLKRLAGLLLSQIDPSVDFNGQ